MTVRAAAVVIAAASALSLAGRAAFAQPTEADVFVQEAVLDLDDKRYDAALEKLARALEREPDHVEALYYSGVAHMAAGRPEAAIPFLARARERSKDASITYQLALAYVALSRDSDARPLLEGLFSQAPTLDSLGYYVGLLRYRAGDYQGALRALRAGRTNNPDIARLTRVYVGLTLAELGLTAQATAEIEQALRGQPASPLTAPAERLRDTLAATRASPRRLRVGASVGFYFDDNASTEPTPSPDATVLGLRRPGRETTGELFAAGADYDWLRFEEWTGTLSAAVITTYNNALPSFNIADFLVGTSLTRQTAVAAMPLALSAAYSFDYVRLDGRELVARHSIPVTVALSETGMHTTVGVARIEVKTYNQTPAVPAVEIQDAVNWLIGVTHLLRFDRDRHFVRVGYQVDEENARGDDYDYVGHRVLVGGLYTLPWREVRVGYDFDVHFRGYLHKNALLPVGREHTRTREDVDMTHTLHVDIPLPRNLTLIGSLTAKRVDSNLAVFDYTRNVYTVTLSWRY